ncbi:DUF4870 domain-containing protein [Sporosarcina sp. Marseille-Q4063]|uniref:DUF4870 domain-containing protein n=1 Tax=Sporosarcina sp. Marseille-Q4063 TaxID=2810514 RepID=UPI001BB09A44|nr:DUF4870 domain-containing protein [Sporosarcina sp. Marseille-Q4063]QUW23507.1 DUF4870 domain-containing protein [Sporosarcina sp. Marseille-Q4063]
MTNQKLLSSLCYFSIFFFPLLLPFVIYLVTDEQEVKNHARRAFISHLIPVILLIAGIIIFSLSMFSFENRMTSILSGGFDFWSFAPFIFTLIYSALFLAVIVWNVFHGVKLLKND